MHVKLTTSGGRRYVQFVESYRDETGRVKKRTVATLGRAEQVDGSLDAVINGLLKITAREPMAAKPPAPTCRSNPARRASKPKSNFSTSGFRLPSPCARCEVFSTRTGRWRKASPEFESHRTLETNQEGDMDGCTQQNGLVRPGEKHELDAVVRDRR
jgi:hypothetical protein